MEFDFNYSNAWRLVTFGMAAASAFAIVINRIRGQPDARTVYRQTAGWIMIVFALGIAVGLGLSVFSSFGFDAAMASLVLAVILGGILSLLAGRGGSS